MNRQTLEDHLFRFLFLDFMFKYQADAQTLDLNLSTSRSGSPTAQTGMDATLLARLDEAKALFMQKWAVEHPKTCTKAGTGATFSVDATQKVRRSVCENEDKEVHTCFGPVIIGCTSSPFPGRLHICNV
jgi:hypothetical protein